MVTFPDRKEDDQQNLSNYSNPVALAALTQRNNEKGGARANLFMKINPWKWLTYRTDFTADGNIDNYQYFLPQYELGYSKILILLMNTPKTTGFTGDGRM